MSSEFSLGTDLQATSGLEHLNVHILTNHLDDLGHQAIASSCDVADLALKHRSVYTECDHVGNNATNFSFCHVIFNS